MCKISEFLSKNFQVLVVEFSIYLNRRVFVMTREKVSDDDGALICNVIKITFVFVYPMHIHFSFFDKFSNIKPTHIFKRHDIVLHQFSTSRTTLF